MESSKHPWLATYPPKPNWHMPIPERFMTDILHDTVTSNPDAIALECLGYKTSWKSLYNMVERCASGLQALGIGKGDKVGLFFPNCLYYVVTYYAAQLIGASVVNINPLYAEKELSHIIEDSECHTIVTLDLALMHDKAKKMLASTRLERIIICTFKDILPFPKNILFPIIKRKDIADVQFNKRILDFDIVCDNDGVYVRPELDLKHDVAVLQYTGGTTGVPKGAMLTHYNITANAAQCLSNFPDPDGQPTMLAVLPFFHVFAMTVCLNMAVMAGMRILTIPRFELETTLKLIHKQRPDYMPAVPAIFSAINAYKKLETYDLTSLQFCISGGAPLPVEVKKKFERKTGCIVVEGYGLSECSPVATVNPPFGENVAGSIGLPLPQTIIEIINPDDKKTPVPFGERGEVCIRGPQVMKGYHNNPDATAEVLRDGRLYTADIGIMDERGYVYIVDRIKDLIITNGYNVYPRNVEEAIYEHPAVEECIVAGIPDKNRGEIVKAWIKLRDERTLTAEDLKIFLADKISKIEIPKRIEFRDEPLPKTMIGKLSRKDIVAEEMDKS